MRFLTLLGVLILSASTWAADTDSAIKVRVALALAASNNCGECRFDEPKCRDEATVANKPLVLFVGDSCGHCGRAAREAGAVACVVESYPHDGQPPTRPRAVVLSPDPAGGWFREGTLLAPTADAVKAAVEKARPKDPPPGKPTGKALDWGAAPAADPQGVRAPVPGEWVPSAPPWYPALPPSVPQPMPSTP